MKDSMSLRLFLIIFSISTISFACKTTKETSKSTSIEEEVDEVLEATEEAVEEIIAVAEEAIAEVMPAVEEAVESVSDIISGGDANDTLRYPQEKYLKNIRQLTFGGDNAEAYWSFDNKLLVFQASNEEWGSQCDQIYVLDPFEKVDKDRVPTMVSTGQGRTTCSYFYGSSDTIIYASTHLRDTLCPPVPERREDGKYVWPIYAGFDIFTADREGNILDQLTHTPGYDAEATVSPNGKKVVFTSMRTGDLELYTMNTDGTDVRQITSELGYDGGAFFSPDGNKLIFRSSRPKTDEEISEYKELLAEGLVKPTEMELYVCNEDGSGLKKITELGNANWAPFFHPSGKKVIFSSNHNSKRGFPFNLFMVNLDGTGLEQVTFDNTFDSFPMFSYDGKYLVFSSNRNNGGTRDTNLFIAEWVEPETKK